MDNEVWAFEKILFLISESGMRILDFCLNPTNPNNPILTMRYKNGGYSTSSRK